jgi:hypothetical protein
MRGDIVAARTHEGLARILRVWRVVDSAVYLTDNKGFTDLESGRKTRRIVALRVDDVFIYDENLCEDGSVPDWSRLLHWSPDN